MPVELRLARELRDSGREDRDRVPVVAEVRRPAPDPDPGVGALGFRLEPSAGFGETGLAVALRLGVERRWEERLAEERPGLGAARKRALGTRSRLPPRRRARGEKRNRQEKKTAPRG